MAEVRHSSSSEGVVAKSGQTQQPSLHPVKLHTSDQPNSGLPSGLTQSFQPDTPEFLQGDEERALSTIYSGLSYSGHSSGDRASPTAAGQSEAVPGQGARPVGSNSSADACPPGISPFSLAPLPLSRAGSESLPASPRPEHQATSHKGRVGDLAAKPPSRLRQQAGPEQQPGVASRSASGIMKSYPGLEHTSPVQSMLKKSLSRSLSSWLQSSLSAQHAANSKSQQSRQQSANLMSKAMSNALSAQISGLERAVSNWAQQAQRDKSHAQPSSNSASRASSGLYSPGLESAISNWAHQAQHDSSYTQSSSNPASRASSGLYSPGLERAISNWAQQAQQQSPQPQSRARAMSGMSDLPGLEQAISSWAQQVQREAHSEESSPEAKPAPSTATAMSGLLEGIYPGLERALSNWAQQGQDSLCHESDSVPSAARALSGMSDMPGLESDMPCPTQQTEQLQEALPRAVSAMSECLYPGLESAILACAQQAQYDSSEQDMQSAATMPRSMSEVSEACYPGLERAISNWAQQAQHDIIRSLESGPAAQGSTPGVPECLSSGLEHAMTDFAKQAHCEILARLQSNASDCLYCPGLEPSKDPPSPEQQPAGTEPSSAHGALAQATGEAILAAARMEDPAAAAKTVTEAVNHAVAGEDQAEAVKEAAKAAVTEAVPHATGSSPAVDEASQTLGLSEAGLSRAASDSPKVLSRAGSGTPKVADVRQVPRAAQASKMLKVHSRDLGQHQQNKHAKLHQKGGPGQGLKAEPAAAENAGTVDMSPLSLQGGAKGVGMQSPGSTGKTADRMAQALRQRELEQMPHMVSASGASARGSANHHLS